MVEMSEGSLVGGTCERMRCPRSQTTEVARYVAPARRWYKMDDWSSSQIDQLQFELVFALLKVPMSLRCSFVRDPRFDYFFFFCLLWIHLEYIIPLTYKE